LSEIRTDARFGDDVYLVAEQFLELLPKRDQVKQAPSVIHIHKQVQVTGFVAVAPGNGTENANVPRSMLGSYAQNFVSFAGEYFAKVQLRFFRLVSGCLPMKAEVSHRGTITP